MIQIVPSWSIWYKFYFYFCVIWSSIKFLFHALQWFLNLCHLPLEKGFCAKRYCYNWFCPDGIICFNFDKTTANIIINQTPTTGNYRKNKDEERHKNEGGKTTTCTAVCKKELLNDRCSGKQPDSENDERRYLLKRQRVQKP